MLHSIATRVIPVSRSCDWGTVAGTTKTEEWKLQAVAQADHTRNSYVNINIDKRKCSNYYD